MGNTLGEQVEMIQLSSRQAEEKVELMECLESLKKNRNFKRVFQDHYMDKYTRRLVSLKAAPGMQDPDQQKFIADQLNAIGHLDQFMNFIFQEGHAAKRLIMQNNEELDRIADGMED